MANEKQGQGLTSGRLVAGALITFALAVGGWWFLGGSSPELEGPSPRVVREDSSSVPITPRVEGGAGWSIEPAETVAISASDLPATGDVAFDLVLGLPATDAQPHDARILSMDVERENRVRELVAFVVDDERMTIRMSIPVEFLTEDQYLIEVQTTEKDHFPLRRYRLDVR